MYESDLTKFMRELFQTNPRLGEAQKEARAIWWDKKVDFEELRRSRESRVPVKGYVYYPLIKPTAATALEEGDTDSTQRS